MRTGLLREYRPNVSVFTADRVVQYLREDRCMRKGKIMGKGMTSLSRM